MTTYKRIVKHPSDIFCTGKEACQILKVDKVKLWRLIRKNQIPYYELQPENLIFLCRSDLQSFVKNLPTQTSYVFPNPHTFKNQGDF